MNYKKKLFFVALSMLLLLLLLGICGTCYAYQYPYKDSDFDTIATHYFTSTKATKLSARLKQFYDWSKNNNYDTCCFALETYSSGYVRGFAFNSSSVTQVVNGNDVNFIQAYINGTRSIVDISYSNNNWSYSVSTDTIDRYQAFGSGGQGRTRYFVCNNDLGSSKTGPFQLGANLITFSEPVYWEYTSNGSNVTINGANQWTYKLIDAGYGVELGQLTDSAWCGKVSYRIAYWNNLTKSFGSYGSFTTLYDKESSSLPMYNVYANVSTKNGDIYTTKILFDTNNFKNCELQIMIEPWATGSGFHNLYQDYYIQGENTIISSGVVYPIQTFSGDYVGEYQEQEKTNNNQNDIADIKDTLTDDSEANNLLNEFTSGDLATNLGFNPLSNPYYDFLYGFLDGIVSTLLDDDNVTLEISYFGKTIILHSEDFITPTNTLTNFIKYILIFFYIFACFKFFYSIYITFETADVEKLKKNLGHDQYYYNDGKYM